MKIVKKGVEKSDDSLENVTGGYYTTIMYEPYKPSFYPLYSFSENDSKIIKEKTGKNVISDYFYSMEELNDILGFDCSDLSEMRGKLYEEFGLIDTYNSVLF